MSSPPTPQAGGTVLVLLPARVRQIAYVVFGIVSLTNGSALVGYATAGGIPPWLEIATAVVAYLAVPFAAIAATNTSKTRAETDPN